MENTYTVSPKQKMHAFAVGAVADFCGRPIGTVFLKIRERILDASKIGMTNTCFAVKQELFNEIWEFRLVYKKKISNSLQ